MDNLTLHYFDAEMRYLREAGQEFAEAFPDRAAQLNLDKPGARDWPAASARKPWRPKCVS